MINISRFTDVQNKLKYKVKGFVKSIKNKIETMLVLNLQSKKKNLKILKIFFIKTIPIQNLIGLILFLH